MPTLFGNATDWTDSLLIGLLAFAIRATVLLLAAWLATRVLRRASAATRHLIWASAVAGVLTLPVLAAVVPAWYVPVISIAANIERPLESIAAPATPKRATNAGPTSSWPRPNPVMPSPTVKRKGVATVQSSVSDAAQAFAGRLTMNGVLAVAWLSLALLLLSRLAIANARVSSWQRSSLAMEDARWLALLRKLSRQYGIERPVVLLENAETDAARAGMKPAPAQRLDTMEGRDPNAVPHVRERQANAADPTGVTANLSHEKGTGGGGDGGR